MIIFAVVLALLVSAISSGAESVLLTVHRFRLAERSLGSRQRSKWADQVAGDPSRLLATILVGNSLANIFLASLVTLWAVNRWGEPAIWIVVPTVTLLILIFGEILPKSLARAHAEGLRRSLLPVAGVAYAVLRPWVGCARSVSPANSRRWISRARIYRQPWRSRRSTAGWPRCREESSGRLSILPIPRLRPR